MSGRWPRQRPTGFTRGVGWHWGGRWIWAPAALTRTPLQWRQARSGSRSGLVVEEGEDLEGEHREEKEEVVDVVLTRVEVVCKVEVSWSLGQVDNPVPARAEVQVCHQVFPAAGLASISTGVPASIQTASSLTNATRYIA